MTRKRKAWGIAILTVLFFIVLPSIPGWAAAIGVVGVCALALRS